MYGSVRGAISDGRPYPDNISSEKPAYGKLNGCFRLDDGKPIEFNV
jgi:hypothetical protein